MAWLRSVALYPKDPEETFVCDYTVGTELTDYVIAAKFDNPGAGPQHRDGELIAMLPTVLNQRLSSWVSRSPRTKLPPRHLRSRSARSVELLE
jgi:hypothetical protein